MKIILIEPLGTSLPLVYRSRIPFLGLITVAALINDGDEIRYLDERFDHLDFNEGADLVALTGLTHQASRAYEIAKAFRERGTPVIMGGIHATMLPEEAGKYVDAVVVGEAEGKWENLVEDLKKGTLRKTYSSSERPDLEHTRIPRRDLLRDKDYIPFDLMQATRGCPLNCEFCSVPQAFGSNCRQRPPEEVINEVRGLAKTFFFVDDNMIVNHRYFESIFEGLKETNKKWFCLGSNHLLKLPGFLNKMIEAGCWALYLDMGPWLSMSLSEGGSGFKEQELYERFLDRLKADGIKVIGSFVFGYDHDDEGVFEKTVDFARSLNIDEAEFHILTPFPGTRLHDRLQREGRIISRDWSKYSATQVVFKPKRISPEKLQEGYRTAWNEFYEDDAIEESEDGLRIQTIKILPD
jgi:radical SAM superfamily enzyme YgiQ (UPF0313 family)